MIFEELSGTDVVIFDDTAREIKSIEEALDEKEIKYEFIKVDLAGNKVDHDLISTIKLIFLDLSYTTNFGSRFDPDFCASLVSSIVPKGKQYYLVAWTKDPDNTDSVIEILKTLNLAPVSYLSKRKEDYRIHDDVYNIEKLFDELNKEFEVLKEVDEFPGEIIEIEKDFVLINCLVDKAHLVFQIRRFDKTPFENYIDLTIGNFVLIRSITKPGSRIFEFSNGNSDLNKYFKKEDPFKGLEDTLFFTE